jgi:glycosyltransferase involved in cell wall biosynthesis
MHADHFFAYTQSSADAIERIGFPRARTTVLNNAVDTRALRQATQSMTPESHKNSAMFIGALDDSKDLPLLVDAANLVHKTTPSFVLDVIGDGPRRPWLEALASQQPWIRVHGPSRDPAFKAMIASKAACFVLTGRIGLAVVEAFALGLPVIATNFPFSAPESGYLEQGKNSLISHPSAPDLAYSITSVLSDQTLRETLAKNAQTSGGQYTLENMIIRFADGILTALESPKRIMASSDARATSTS